MFTKSSSYPKYFISAVGGMMIQGHGKSLSGSKLTCCHGIMTCSILFFLSFKEKIIKYVSWQNENSIWRQSELTETLLSTEKVAEFRLHSAWLPHYAVHPFVNTIVEAPPDKWIIQDYWTEGKEGSFLISPDGYGLIQNGEFLSKV